MHLRIVPPPSGQPEKKLKPKGPDGPDNTSMENAGVLFLAFVLIVVPLSTYTIGRDMWGHEVGTHIGFATGVICILIGSYVLFFSGIFYKFDWD